MISFKNTLSKKFKGNVLVKSKLYNGTQTIYKFDNGYGASVSCHDYSYGVEVAVIKFRGLIWDITFKTDVTSDVIGNVVSDFQLDEILERIKGL